VRDAPRNEGEARWARIHDLLRSLDRIVEALARLDTLIGRERQWLGTKAIERELRSLEEKVEHVVTVLTSETIDAEVEAKKRRKSK
jgi:hypothetical protein